MVEASAVDDSERLAPADSASMKLIAGSVEHPFAGLGEAAAFVPGRTPAVEASFRRDLSMEPLTGCGETWTRACESP